MPDFKNSLKLLSENWNRDLRLTQILMLIKTQEVSMEACWLQPALAKRKKTVAQGSSVSYNMVFSRNNWHETLLGGFVSHQLWLKPRPIVRREAKVHNSEQLLSWEVFDSKQCGHVQQPPKPSLLNFFQIFQEFWEKEMKKVKFQFCCLV